MKLWSSAFLAIIYGAALVFIKPVPYRSNCADVTPVEQWGAYKKLVQKVATGYLSRKTWGVVILITTLVYVIDAVIERWDLVVANWLSSVLALFLLVILVGILTLVFYPVWIVFTSTIASDQIEWPHIKRCLKYMAEDPDLSDSCKLDVIKEFAASSSGSQWGAVSLQGVIFGITIALVFANGMQSWQLDFQFLTYVFAFAAGVGTFFNALYANANTVVFRAVVLWQNDPAQAKNAIEGNASQRKPSPFKPKL